MTIKTSLLITTALLASLTLNAQQPTSNLTFRAVLLPGMSIGGATFTSETTLRGVALNDAGEIVFVAWVTEPYVGNAIFTSQRAVARAGDVIDGKHIALIANDAAVAINASGQVAYEAWYGDTTDIARGGFPSLGIFVDKHLALTPHTGGPTDFTLTDDGHVVLKASVPVPSPTSSVRKKPSIFDVIGVKPLNLPRNIPIMIKPPSPTQPAMPQSPPPAAVLMQRAALPVPRLPMAFNHRGQVLLPLNLSADGFLLLLGTPAAQ
jgi:hypothetical protein